jgi:excisionase family DNA binding protein
MIQPTTTPPIEKLAYRIDEAAVAFGLSRSKIYELIGSGELRSIKAGGRRLILRDDAIAFLNRA